MKHSEFGWVEKCKIIRSSSVLTKVLELEVEGHLYVLGVSLCLASYSSKELLMPQLDGRRQLWVGLRLRTRGGVLLSDCW